MCDRQDIGVSIGNGEQGDELDPRHAPVSIPDEPRIFIYDNYPGGIGFSQPLFGMHRELLRRTREVIAGCDCEHGCPTCVGPVGNTGPLAKLVALRILDRMGFVSLDASGSAPALEAAF
jgi:DEAD/DEAH box helicase domain-containing protein